MSGTIAIPELDKLVRYIIPTFEDLGFFSHLLLHYIEVRWEKTKDLDSVALFRHAREKLEASRVRLNEFLDQVVNTAEISREESVDLAKKLRNLLGSTGFLIISDAVIVGEDLAADLLRKSKEESRFLEMTLDELVVIAIRVLDENIERFRKLEGDFS